MASWIGCSVSVNCGEPLGYYQGTILEADGTTITLTKAFRNGFPYPKPQVTLNAADIKDLKIIEQKNDSNEKTHSTIAVTKNSKKANRSTVSENIQNNTTSSTSNQLSHHNGPVQHRPQQPSASTQVGNSNANQTNNTQPFGSLPKENSMGLRSKPIDIQNRQNKQNLAGSGGILGTTPNKKERQRKKNEACFGTPSDDPIMNEEFDFEKNLALFDKQALWEELNQAQKPDLVRQTDNARRQPASQAKFRHYENVLTPQPATYRAITIPENGRGPKEYVTDEGLVVPSVNPSMRRRLWTACSKAGLAAGAPELMARAGTDTALRLLGGGRRLDPRNAHQAPTVVVLVGPHREGITGVACARQLTTHGVNTVLLVSGADLQGTLRPYLNLYQLTGNKLTTNIEDLPTADLIIIALGEHGDDSTSFRHLAEWTCHSRAPVLALDPPPQGTNGIVTKFSLLPILPLSHSADNGKLYLCNLSVPAKIFTDLDIQYRSPFGAKHVIALHPDDS